MSEGCSTSLQGHPHESEMLPHAIIDFPSESVCLRDGQFIFASLVGTVIL